MDDLPIAVDRLQNLDLGLFVLVVTDLDFEGAFAAAVAERLEISLLAVGNDVETVMKNADTAMYHAKAHGRNNYQFFAEEMNRAAGERLSIEARLPK